MKKPMIEPSEVNLLIFDLDGTIHPATKAGNRSDKKGL